MTTNSEEALDNFSDKLVESLVNSRDELEKQFTRLHEDLVHESFNKFFDYIECNFKWDLERLVNDRVKQIIHDLLEGRISWLKDTAIISQWTFHNLQKIRLAIWRAGCEDIENSIVTKMEKQIEALEEKVKTLERYYQ